MTSPLARTAFLSCLLLVASCDVPVEPEEPRPPTHEEYGSALADSALAGTLLGAGWLEAADSAVSAPTVLTMPHHERGVFLPAETRSVGIAFDAVEGQRLHITLEVSEDSEGRLFADLWFLDLEDDAPDPRHVTSLTDFEGGVIPLEESGRYVLRLQPELLATIDYSLRMELDAALAFPVSGHGPLNVASVFGDPRDGGRRRHEGIDIFAPRATPVVAVVDGTAVEGTSKLGGNTVWLRGRGSAYYYAHLDEVAIEGRERVAAGDVLGFVGNTGNAVTAPPHLHFGIYRRGRGALDPLPWVVARTFEVSPRPVDYEPGFAMVTTDRLNLRPSPGTARTPVGRLPDATLLRVVGATREWLRVRTLDERAGWIHHGYQAKVSAAKQHTPERDAWLLSNPRAGIAVGRVRAETTWHVFAEVPGWRLVGADDEAPSGWLAAPAALAAPASP